MKSEQPLKILYLAAEVVPFAKTGGLADVAGSLPKAVHALGHDIRVAMPRYGPIDKEKFKLKEVLPPFPVPLDEGTELASILEASLGEVWERSRRAEHRGAGRYGPRLRSSNGTGERLLL